jgi:hypothetical protein
MNTFISVAEIKEVQTDLFDKDSIMLKIKTKGDGWIRMIISRKMARSLITSLEGDLFNAEQ